MKGALRYKWNNTREKTKQHNYIFLTFSAKDFTSFSLSKYRILAASEKDIQLYAFSAQAAISSLKKIDKKKIETEERNFEVDYGIQTELATHLYDWLLSLQKCYVLPISRKIQPKLLNHKSAEALCKE